MKKAGAGAKLSRGRWQIQRERCRLADRNPPPPDKEARPVADVVAGIMKKIGAGDQHWLAVLENEWTSLVGEAVAEHARPGRFENGRLTVFVDSSVWLNELARYGKSGMLENLRKQFGQKKIRSISLVPDPGDGRDEG